MPKIPTSKPQDVRAKPSVGGQVNINSQDSFFRSIASASAEAGQLVEQARVEKQKAIDVKEANQVKIYQDERAAELEARLNESDISEHSRIIDDFAAQNKKLEFAPGVSKTAREALQQSNDLWTQQLYSNSMSWSAKKAEQDKMATGEQVVANAINAMDIDGAIAGIRSLGLSPELQQAKVNEAFAVITKKQEDNIKANRIERNGVIKDSMDVAYEKGLSENLDLIKADARNKGVWNDELEADYLRYKKGVEKKKFDDASAQLVAGISLGISRSKTLEDIKGVENYIDKLKDDKKISVEQAFKEKESAAVRSRAIVTAQATKLRDSIALISSFRSDAETGTLDLSILESLRDNLDAEVFESLIDLNLQTQGSIGIDSGEYMDALEGMQKFIGGIPGAWTDEGRKVFDADAGMIKDFGELIKGDFTQSAKLKLLSTFAAAMYTDAVTNDISVFADGGKSDVVKEELKIDSAERKYAKHMMSKLFSKVAKPGVIPSKIKGDTAEEIRGFAQAATAKKSLIDAEDAYDLLKNFWNEERIKGVDESNYDKLIKEFEEELKTKIQKSSSKRLDNYVLNQRKKLSEIIRSQ